MASVRDSIKEYQILLDKTLLINISFKAWQKLLMDFIYLKYLMTNDEIYDNISKLKNMKIVTKSEIENQKIASYFDLLDALYKPTERLSK